MEPGGLLPVGLAAAERDSDLRRHVLFALCSWYGLGRGWIEGLRTDSLYFFSTGIRTSQMVALLSCVVAVVLLLCKMRTHPSPEALYVNRKKRMEHTGEEN